MAAPQNPDTFIPLSTFEISGGIAEIVDVTPDDNTLVYSDAGSGAIGLIDVTDPANPTALATVPVNGEPTSVSVVDHYAFANVWVDKPEEDEAPPAFLPAELVVIDIANPAAPVVVGSVAIGYHPDSLKVKKYGNRYVAVVAIENEPVVVENGVVTGDDEPGDPNDISPAGYIQIIDIDVVTPANSSVVDIHIPAIDLQFAGCLYPNDPQPEFVDIHGTTAAISLQENNGIAIVDIQTQTLTRVFSTVAVADRAADIFEEDEINFGNTYPGDVIAMGMQSEDPSGNIVPAGVRCPDAIAFSPSGEVLYTADEGEFNFTGGRGWSAWNVNTGAFLWDDGGALEAHAVARGHYPEGRSANKGVEMEGIAQLTFGGRNFVIVTSERGSFAAVYRISNEKKPRFLQLLPTGISPEGVVGLISKNVFVTSEEVSGTLTFFQGVPGKPTLNPDQPVLISSGVHEPWAAISGMTARPGSNAFLFVPDNALPTDIFQVNLGSGIARVDNLGDVTLDGQQARYDGEGICIDTSIIAPSNQGVWIASEGDADEMPNLLVQIDNTGAVLMEIQLPASIDEAANAALPGTAQGGANGEMIRSNGFEGVCLSSDGRYLYAAIQRDFAGEFSSPKYARIARYDLRQTIANPGLFDGLRAGGDWEFFFYQLDSDDSSNWAGLSEIINLGGDQFAVIERDKGIGAESQLKKIYEFNLAGLTADTDGLPDASDTIVKTELFDIRDAFSPLEKVEGLALIGGNLWVGLDNDGGEVEPRVINLGPLP